MGNKARSIKRPQLGYKIFKLNKQGRLQCRNYVFGTVKTAVKKRHTIPVEPVVCSRGFHFCKKLEDCFHYYTFRPEGHVVCIVKAHTTIAHRKDKSATNDLEIVKILTLDEVNALLTKQNPTETAAKIESRKIQVDSRMHWNGKRDVRIYRLYDVYTRQYIEGLKVPKEKQRVRFLGSYITVRAHSKWRPIGDDSRIRKGVDRSTLFERDTKYSF